MPHAPRHAIAALAAIALSACSFSPLAHRVKVGEEPFIVFVGEGRDQHTDLFAVSSAGGPVSQFTFTSLVEMGPRLAPGGEQVAFLRMRDTALSEHREVVVMNLLGGGDAIVTLPPDAGRPVAVAWADDGSALYVRTDSGVWRASAPPAAAIAVPVTGNDRATADSALDIWLGTPRFARVIRCASGGLCIMAANGDSSALAPDGRDALRWGNDSVAWFQADGMVVRSLGPGHERQVTWKDGPAHPRDGSYARGTPQP